LQRKGSLGWQSTGHSSDLHWAGPCFIGWMGYNLKLESLITKKEIKLKINCSETLNNNINNNKNMNNEL